MKTTDYNKSLREVSELNNNEIFHYWKGRVALSAIFKAIDLSEDDEVILPAFTCVVVPNAILYLKAKPIYVDINLKTYNTTLKKIKSKVTPKTKVVICQNTFGLSSEVDEISKWCKQNNIITIEDCTHGFGGKFKGSPNGSFCDFAFYSSQWNKPHSTGIGGFAIVNDSNYITKLRRVNKDLIKPGLKSTFILKSLIFTRKNLVSENNYWRLLKLYRYLSKKNLVVGSSSGEEISSIEEPKKYFSGASKTQIKEGEKSVKSLKKDIILRKENALIYYDFLQKNNKTNVSKDLFDNHSFLKYPLLVSNQTEFLELAKKNKIELGEWFNSPIHPVQQDFKLWKLNIEEFPNAKKISKLIVNLPTDTNNINNVLSFLEKNLKYIC